MLHSNRALRTLAWEEAQALQGAAEQMPGRTRAADRQAPQVMVAAEEPMPGRTRAADRVEARVLLVAVGKMPGRTRVADRAEAQARVELVALAAWSTASLANPATAVWTAAA